MKVPLNWLRDYVSLPDPATLVERLTLAGLEVASARCLGVPKPAGLRVKSEDAGPVWDRDKIVIAQIVRVEQHPNADRLKLPYVDYGQGGEPKQLVTGAPNINVGDVGQKVVLALTGSVLIDGHAEERKLSELKPTKIRGIPSDAMVCSLLELGVSERKEDHAGIIILENDAPVGMPLVDFMGDIVLEIDVLPNMARCLSILGIAREVAALFDGQLKPPPHAMQATGAAIASQVQVRIENPQLSARYAAALLRDVKVGDAPGWMQRRLLYAGMRPINNIVDITNYVMLEWGQPLHAFDYDILAQRAGGKAPTIVVRAAHAGEKLTTLDGVERTLTTENLVIADEAGPIALAGVMGGRDTEVSATTRNVLLESASFDFVSIRRTMKALNLPSEASMRFSKGIHPELVPLAAGRAAELMRQHAGATICQGLVDCYPAPLPVQVIELSLHEIRRVLGVFLPQDEIVRILRSLEFQVQEPSAGMLHVTVPPHRLDIQAGPADIIEDLARIHGYDRLPATLLADPLPEQRTNLPLVFEERVRDLLAGLGLQEVINYALTMPEREAPLGVVPVEYVRLLNPISSERVVMRQSVLASVLEVAANNLRHTDDVRLFELGRVYLPRQGQKLPEEPRRLAVVLTGKRRAEFWSDTTSGETAPPPLDFYDLKGVIAALLGDLHLPQVQYQPATAPYLHRGRAAAVLVAGTAVGSFGQMHPRVAEAYNLGQRVVLVGELDLEALQAALPPRYQYAPVARFPAALRDIAVEVPETLTAEKLEAEIRAGGGELLRGVRLFDLYRGGSIAAGSKSLAYALTYQAEDRTLTDKEVDKAHKKIEDRLKHVLKAQIRGQD